MSRSLLLIFVAFAVSACANTYHPYTMKAKEVAALSTQPFTPDGLNESDRNAQTFNCPSASNVNPDYDWEFNGTGFFTVCPSRLNPADILVHGSTRTGGSGTVCVFPAQIAANGQVFAKPDVNKNDGSPWVQCLAPEVDGVHMSFPGISWNAAFIVD